MASYSILVLDADDRACGAVHVSEATDRIALQVAVGIIPRGSVAEVWLGGRMVSGVKWSTNVISRTEAGVQLRRFPKKGRTRGQGEVRQR